MSGIIIKNYSLKKLLGVGGFAEVWLAEKADGTKVAIKIPKVDPRKTLSGKDIDEFIGKVELWSKLKHEHILQVLDYGYSQAPYTTPYIVLELCEKTLRDVIDTLSEDQIVDIAIKIAEALEFANLHGVIHRDIKPENILICNGEPKVSDWGIAKILLKATSTSGYTGTPLYSAPEQLNPDEFGDVDWRTDIWQFGCLLYEMFEKEPPFYDDFPGRLAIKILTKKPREPKKMPKWIKQIVMKCLEKRKENRWRSISLIISALKPQKITLEKEQIKPTTLEITPKKPIDIEIPEALPPIEKVKLILEKKSRITTIQLADTLDISIDAARKLLTLLAIEIAPDTWSTKEVLGDTKQKVIELTEKQFWTVSKLAKELNVSDDVIKRIVKELNFQIFNDIIINPNLKIEIPKGMRKSEVMDAITIGYSTDPSVIYYSLTYNVRKKIANILLPLIEGDDKELRWCAVVGLASAFRGTLEEGLKIFHPLIVHHDKKVCMAASIGIGLAFQGTGKTNAADILNSLLQNSDRVIRRASAMAFGLVFQGTGEKSVLESLKPLVHDYDCDVSRCSVVGNGFIFQRKGMAGINHLKQYFDTGKCTREGVILSYGFSFQGTGDERILKILEPLIRDQDKINRRCSAVALGLAFQGTADESIIRILKPLIRDTDKTVRKASAVALGLVFQGSGNNYAIDTLEPLIKDSDKDVRWGAAIALGLIFQGINKESAIKILEPLIYDSDKEVRWGAAIALGHILLGAGEKGLTYLNPLIIDSDSIVRMCAAFSLGLVFQGAGENGLKALQPMLKDSSSAVRLGAALGIGLLADRLDLKQSKSYYANLGILWYTLYRSFWWLLYEWLELFAVWV